MADIRTKLILDNANFNRNIDESTQKTEDFNTGLGTLSKVAVLGAKAVAGLAVAINGLAFNQARLGAQLQDTSNKLGLNVEFLQEFRFAAEQVGISSQTADMALQRFTRRLSEAARGEGEAEDALKQLGIQLRDANGNLRDTDEILFDVADQLEGVESQSERVRIAFKLFDSEGVALVNTLSKGSDEIQKFADRARELDIVLTQQETQRLKNLDDSFTELGLVLKGLADDFVLGLAEALEITNQEMINMINNNKELARTLGAGVGEALKTTAATLEVIVENIDLVRNALIAMISVKALNNLQILVANLNNPAKRAKLLAGAIALATSKITILITAVTTVTLLLRKFGDVQFQLGQTTTTANEILAALGSTIVKVIGDLADFVVNFPSKLAELELSVTNSIDFMKESLTNLGEATAEAFLLLPRLALAAMIDVKNIFTGQFEEIGSEIARVWRDSFLGESYNATLQFFEDIVGDYRRTKQEIEDDGPLRIEIRTDNVGEAEEGPGQNFSEYTTEFMSGWNQAFNNWKSEVEDTAKFGREVFNKFANGLTDTLTTFFMTGKADFRGFLQDILQMIIKSGIQRALAGIFSGLGGLGSEGGILSSLFGGPRADGGPVSPNKSYLVGERGPEMFVPDSAGTIVPNEQLGASRQTGMQEQVTNNYITNNISAIDSKSVAQLFAENRQTLLGTVQLAQRETPF